MRLGPGVRVGPYEVVAPLGAGGMAEVYRARDTRLARDVALKMVTEALSSDPDLVRRFEQEARVAGSLNHPNIAAVYDVGLHEGTPYFVTELLRGESLRARLTRGAVPTSTALDWATQMARGLAAAHTRGVVHRDVKPDNVFVCSDGQVKLLDFGIAKLTESAALTGAHDLMEATVTPTGGGTRTGSVLGTPGYMSPEQLRGETLDSRSDIFSWAATVYEVLAGHRAFPGATLVESGYSILHRDPEPLPPEVPGPVAEVVFRCLDKDQARRVQSASDLAFALEVVGHATGSAARQLPSGTRWRSPGRLAIGAIAAALLLAWTAASVRGRPSVHSAPVLDFEPASVRWGAITAARFLPDGRTAFSAAFEDKPEQIFVRPAKNAVAQEIGISDARLMAGLGNAELAIILHPQWQQTRLAVGLLARVPSTGGTPRSMAEEIEFADSSSKGELVVVRVAGTSQALESPPGKVLFSAHGGSLTNPRFSHSGERIAFLHHPVWGSETGGVVVVDRNGQAKALGRREYETAAGLAWSPDDSEVWFSARDSIRAVDLAGRERVVHTDSSTIQLQDINTAGDVLLISHFHRCEMHYLSRSGTRRLLSYTAWNAGGVPTVLDSGAVLFTADGPIATEENGSFSVLRNIDGSPPQVLERGVPLDLSSDGRFALVQSEGGTQLNAVPTGPGQTRTFVTKGLTILVARFLPGNTRVVTLGRPPSGNDYRLYILDSEESSVTPVGQTPLGGGRASLHLSPDGRVVATTGADGRLALISIANGSSLPVPPQFLDAWPVGWSAQGHLWLREGGRSPPARARLFRADPQSGQVLEERIISPPELAGVSFVGLLAVSPSGEHVVFYADRKPGRLLISRGLWHPE